MWDCYIGSISKLRMLSNRDPQLIPSSAQAPLTVIFMLMMRKISSCSKP